MFERLEDRMQKTLETLIKNFSSVRTGRANPDLLKRIMVDYYGSQVPIQQLANLSAPEPKIVAVQVFDRGAISSVEKAIQKSDLGLTPNTEGNIIRLIIPDLTEERRRELDKVVKRIAEEGRVAVRNLRRDALDELKKPEKDKNISEDEKKRAQDQIQKVTDKYIKKIEDMLIAKEKDLKEI
ncbi:MAG: ribosome recycling factor [Candidatus Margulisiibacteriota bacterium]|nr:MAG: ribosome recycling factor [Candidatus Margulisbacteria bacterium GWD2_39_127]OGI05552.1 MAG: ribosome recycling factor [Candidatus Margulisbacteria bacterium GWF2_38_17]OGI08366.1 MAG: ribosome recycling factor [Candidatus Margulisbacteria bacterium GWE2_39_32]PZM77337.1 MAG: ribosome recycling factor [Candidatus Margulisiibacteriota bacterium]HAR63153.1 ribosome recycling factor [Candidatus Margulisiibacteriota bacterium]